MAIKLALKIGESFAEIRALSADSNMGQKRPKPLHQARWFLPKCSLADGLREALTASGAQKEGGELYIISTRHDRALCRRQGLAPAFLVTAGFESHLRVDTRISVADSDIIAADRVFGLNERITATGEIITPLKIEELDLLAAKLEAMKVKQIAIGFMNSTMNSVHEVQAAGYLRERGFSVLASHTLAAQISSPLDEVARWRLALECQSTAGILAEDLTAIESVLQETLGADASQWQIKVHVIGKQGFSPLKDYSPAAVHGGLESALERAADAHLTRTDAAYLLHFGIESFHIVRPSSAGAKESSLAIQPTTLLGIGNWGIPVFENETRSYVPGPMLFGKSHQLCFIDVLFSRDRLTEVEGFTPLVNEKARARILDTIFTLGKALSAETGRTVDASEITADLEVAGIERIALEIATAKQDSVILLSGAFAPSLEPLLKLRRPDLVFQVLSEGAWYEADACFQNNDSPQAQQNSKKRNA